MFDQIPALYNKTPMEIETETETLTREELFIKLYEEAFPAAAQFIKKMGGNLDDAKDIFQDTLIIYYEKTRHQDWVMPENEKAYLLGIGRHLWYQKHRKDEKRNQSVLLENIASNEENAPGVSQRVFDLIAKAGKKCLELLQSFYFEKKKMTEIAEHFRFSGERSATAQKYKCLEKVRTEIKRRSLNQEDFYE